MTPLHFIGGAGNKKGLNENEMGIREEGGFVIIKNYSFPDNQNEI